VRGRQEAILNSDFLLSTFHTCGVGSGAYVNKYKASTNMTRQVDWPRASLKA